MCRWLSAIEGLDSVPSLDAIPLAVCVDRILSVGPNKTLDKTLRLSLKMVSGQHTLAHHDL